MKKLFTFFLTLTCVSSLFAYDCFIDGIYYNLNTTEMTATVTNETGDLNAQSYSGTVIIPSSFTYNSKTYSVTTIGDFAFYGCSGLTSVTIGNSVTTIGDFAFDDCIGLTSITIPNSVTTIGGHAFSGCTSLPVIDNIRYADTYLIKVVDETLSTYLIKEGTKWIGDNAFSYCSSLTSVTIPNSVTTIGDNAFSWCKGLTLVTIPNSVTTIEREAFYGCSGLTLVTIGNSVQTIGASAFKYCSYLTSITIPNSVTTIGSSAFESCSSLTSITIPYSVTTIGDDAFFSCNGLTKTNYTGNIADWCKIEYKSGSSNPICYSHNLFINDVEIKDLVIPEGVDKIGDRVFQSCYGLSSVTIDNSVTTIGKYAFESCRGLTSITIGNSVKTIEGNAFSWCEGLNSVTIGDSVTTIGSGAFLYCRSLKSVIIPNSVITIGTSAFESCKGLTSVTIGNSVTTIGEHAFSSCSGLTSITIPNSVTTIGSYAFALCTGLTSITIPNSVMTIGSAAFSDCSGLISITIGNSVKTIGSSAFESCSSLTSITIPNSIKTIETYTFYNCSRLISVTLPNSVTTIGSGAFALCNGLTSITIGNSVKTIGTSAFGGCSNLTSITIPNSVTTIEHNAFYNCNNIKSVCVLFSNPFEADYSDAITKNFESSTLSKKIQCIEAYDISPTCATVTVDLTNVDVSKYSKMCLNYNEQEYALQAGVNTILLTGLHPNKENNLSFFSQLPSTTNWIEGATIEVTTPELTLTTLTPKVVSAGTAVVAAETNISDYETNVGFEWRKYDAPESMPSKSGAAIICNGVMEGRLLNLGTDSYWNVRPYYEAADGTRYYGEWITFDPSDFSYFEPTVHTYALTTSPTSNNVQVRGYVMTGTDEVTEQGFEYWANGAAAPQRVAATTSNDVQRVTATGQLMTAVLENLAYNTTYTCRAYALANGKTYYGEEIQFLTPENTTGLFGVFMNNSNAQKVTKYLHNGQLIIDRNGQHYSATGQKLR